MVSYPNQTLKGHTTLPPWPNIIGIIVRLACWVSQHLRLIV